MRKTAIVTGGSGGIGQATAISLAASGYDLLITYVSRASGAEHTCNEAEKLGSKCVAVKADIGNADELENLFKVFDENFDHLDLLVNNGALDKQIGFLDVTPEDYDKILNVNLKGCYFCEQKAAQRMVKQNTHGVIINISSVHAEANWPDYTLYAISKAGLSKLTKNTALELAKYGIRVVAVHPGYIEVGTHNDEEKGVEGKIPMQRFGTVDECAELIKFLASDKASYITGSIFNVDGGVLLPVCTENYFND